MPQAKKSKKNKRRGSTPTRTPQPRARRDGGQASPAASGPGVKPSAGLVMPTSEYSRLIPAAGTPAPVVPVRSGSSQVGLAAAAAAEAPPAHGPGTPAVAPDSVPSWAAKAMEELLTMTYWLDPGEHGDPTAATIRFSGRRSGVTGKPQPGDTFWQEETVGILPGSGPVAISAQIRGIHPGEWTVTARPVTRRARGFPPVGADPAAALRVPWPRRVTIPAGPDATIHTARLGRSKVPGIVRFAYASMVGLAVLAGLGLQALLLADGHYPVLGPLAFSAIAVAAGAIGGKAWFVAAHRGKKFDGWCIQGFVGGAAVVVAAAAFAGPGVPAGVYLGSAAPALLIGMAIGRPGCFWAGCCTGRPTASRWGIWSSDRRVGCRREPAQLLEALAALIAGAAVLGVVLLTGLARSGPAAVAGLAAYTLIRQLILGLRAEPRQWRYGRLVTGVVAAIMLAAAVVLLA